jgi:hypothetical protein
VPAGFVAAAVRALRVAGFRAWGLAAGLAVARDAGLAAVAAFRVRAAGFGVSGDAGVRAGILRAGVPALFFFCLSTI